MKDTKFRILLDIHEVRSQATIPVKVGDVSCKIYITLVEGGKPYKIHENSFGVFTGKKGDDKYLFNNCVIENGIIRYDFTPQTVAAAGVLECEIRIYDEDGGVLTTPSFNIVVDERAVNDSELASTTEFTFLDEIIVNEGQRMENEINRIEAFNNLGIDLEDDGEVISIVKTDIDGSQEKASFLKYADVIPPVTATATGNAITIESSQAPIPYLKLSGKTTKNGDTLTSTGDSGSFEVGVYGGKNLLPNNATTGTTAGVTFTINADKSISVSGTPTGVAVLTLPITLPAGTYILSGAPGLGGNAGLFLPIAELGGNISQTYNEVTFTLTETLVSEVRIRIGTDFTAGKCTFYPMIRLATETDNTYEPCNKQTLTMPYTLRSAKSGVTDEIDLTRGVHIQRAKEFNLRVADMNNSETFAGWTVVSGVTECFKANYSDIVDALTNVGTKIGYNTINGQMQLFFPKSVYGLTQTEWKTNYPDLVVKVVLPLITPIETPLTETELNAYRQLYTNKGTTTILSEADMEVDYYINKPNAQAIGNIHSQVNADYFKLQQAIISTGGN